MSAKPAMTQREFEELSLVLKDMRTEPTVKTPWYQRPVTIDVANRVFISPLFTHLGWDFGLTILHLWRWKYSRMGGRAILYRKGSAELPVYVRVGRTAVLRLWGWEFEHLKGLGLRYRRYAQRPWGPGRGR